jgi:hypothetical protein
MKIGKYILARNEEHAREVVREMFTDGSSWGADHYEMVFDSYLQAHHELLVAQSSGFIEDFFVFFIEVQVFTVQKAEG